MTSRRVRLATLAVVLLTAPVAAACSGPWVPEEPGGPPTTQPEVLVVEGRPLRRRRGRLHVAASRTRSLRVVDAAVLELDPLTRAALADHWRTAAEMEHASVVAFRDLARRLRAVGAPAALVQRALHASVQERDHARRCFDLASRYCGAEVRAGRLRQPRRRPRSRQSELTRLAVEAWRDGVMNEGFAAHVASEQRRAATDARVIDTLDVIARDEAEHAALSADVLAWCRVQGGASVDNAVRQAMAEHPMIQRTRSPIEGADLRLMAAHGAAPVVQRLDSAA